MIKVKKIFVIKILFFNHDFSPLNIFKRKWNDPVPYLSLTDPDATQGSYGSYGSYRSGCGLGTLENTSFFYKKRNDMARLKNI
jgi:hypothetical protein